jgi:hypothetical protein
VNKHNLYISQTQDDQWFAHADIEDQEGPSKYVVIGDSLAEIRKLVSEGVSGDLGIPGIEFEEVFEEIQIPSF